MSIDDDELHERIAGAQEQALFEVEPDWKDHWGGMPGYEHQDLMPEQSVLVHFRNIQDRDAFAKLVQQNVHAKTKFIWYPKAEIRKASDKVFTTGDQRFIPRYPIYIISKGRWDTRLTSKAFEWLKVPYHIVVEPQEYERYAAVIDKSKIIVTPFSNLGQGGIPARNFVWQHADSIGAKRHWIFDDNISGFCRFHDNLKVEVDSGATICAIEDWCDRYENLVMAAFNYDYFAPRKQGTKIKPITLNTRCYSGILLRNDIVDVDGNPIRWRGRYNEDTDLSLRILKDGYVMGKGGRYATALFNAFLMYKKPTLTMKGGNTDELYAGAEAMAAAFDEHAKGCKACGECVDGYPTEKNPQAHPCDAGVEILKKDGRWLMAESLREQHPQQTTVERKWRRWQHQVDYRAFRDNKLVPRTDVAIAAEANEYGMEFDAMPKGWGSMGHDARASMMGAQQKAATVSAAVVAPAAPPASIQRVGGAALDFLGGLPEPAEPPKPVQAAPVAVQPPASVTPKPEGRPFLEALPARTEPPKPESLPVVEPPKPEPVKDWEPSAADVKSLLAEMGHKLEVRDGRLIVSNAEALPMDVRTMIADRYGEFLAVADPIMPEVKMINAKESSIFSTTKGEVQYAAALTHVDSNFVPDEPPILDGIDDVVLNFACDGVDWAKNDRPVGVTVSTLDGQLTRFLPFRFAGGNLDEGQVKRWAQEQLRGKRIVNVNTRFEVHMAREWGVDLEANGNTVSDVMHYAALLDDHRKRFALDVLINDFLPDVEMVPRVDETMHHQYDASEVAKRELFTVKMTAKLRETMWPKLDAENLQKVRQLEDDVIYPLVEMEKNGSPIDVELLEQYSEECTSEHGRLMREIADEAGFAFEHTNSGWSRLFDRCNLTPRDSYAEAVILSVDHPLIRKAYFASQIASLNSKTFAAYRRSVDSTGLLRYGINQLRGDEGGTVSGRFSIGYVQQVPNKDNHSAIFEDRWFPRRLFIPRVGSYFEADAAQIEYRLFAHFAENPQVIQAYKNDPWLSFHKMTWAEMKKYKADMLYSHMKSFNFARQYGAKMMKLAIMMGFITAPQAEEIKANKRWNDPRLTQIKEIEKAYSTFMPEGDKLLDYASHLAKPACDEYCKKGDNLHKLYQHRGYVKTIEGRRSRFYDNYKTYIGLNRVIQGSAADIMKRKLVELHRERKNTGLLMRLTVHDAVGGDAQTPETHAKVSEVLNAQSYDLKVPILWECKSGPNWADAK